MEKEVADQNGAEKKEKKSVLPFVTNASCWNPKTTKDIFLEGVIGDLYALNYLDLLRRGGIEALKYPLSRIVGDMVDAGKYSCTEIHFISTLDTLIRSYGVPSINVDQYRFWSRSNILGMLEMKIPESSKLKILKYLANA
jgi:hypothetical protein